MYLALKNSTTNKKLSKILRLNMLRFVKDVFAVYQFLSWMLPKYKEY